MRKGFWAIVISGILTLNVVGGQPESERKSEKNEAGKKEKVQVIVVEKKKTEKESGGSGKQSSKSGTRGQQ